jgi:hypothetical protein
MNQVVALLLLALPVSAFAQAPDRTPPRWSLGAGVSFGGSSVATASLERAVGERTWLVFGVAGSMTRERADVTSGLGTELGSDGWDAVGSIGVRRAVTSADAPVTVSLHAVLEGGAHRRSVEVGAVTEREERGWLAGASGGLAVERALADRLAVRVFTSLVGVRYTSFEEEFSSGSSGRETELAAEVRLAPGLELRVAF